MTGEASVNEKKCGNCRFKGEPINGHDEETDTYGPTGFFLCGLIKMGDDSSGAKKMRAESGSSFVVDGSGYYAALCVADDFGCNRWEPGKPASD